jgi:hypothetical protein
LANHRLRLIIAALAALLVPAALAGPALAAHVRVEGKSRSIFQGNARPFVGTLRGHTTTKRTALGSLVKASRKQPFALRLTWSDCCGGAWNGFFVSSIAHVTPPFSTAYWAFKLNQKLSSSGLGSTRVTRDSHVLVYYTTFDPATGATEPTLGIKASTRKPPVNGTVTFRVRSYDDAGTATPAAGALVRVNGVPHTVNANGAVTLRFARGASSVRAVEPGAIRSQKLWVHAS